MHEVGTVYLVGAGCGKADLITLRGLRLLRSCDAVVYDDLIDKALLQEIPDNAQIICMGKRRGKHSATQDEICSELIRLAREGKTVVRLKGGDPFVFGRGGEEMLALGIAGIPCEVVPGISSAIAIPAMAGIPVTFRNVSRSVHIVTAHTAGTPDGLPENLRNLAAVEGTLVFLMGLSQLEEITAQLMEAGMPADTPAAVLSGGNTLCPADVRGMLGNIALQTCAAGVEAPAVILIGKVAGFDLRSAAQGPLEGATIGLTGSAQMTRRLADALQARGANTFVAQQSELHSLDVSPSLEEILHGESQWLVFTSANGVREFFRKLDSEHVDRSELALCSFAVIGPATGRALLKAGFFANLCPPVHTTQALAADLLKIVPQDEQILLLRSAQGSPQLLCELLEAGYRVRDVHLYEAMDDLPAAHVTQEQIDSADYLVFTSAGGVQMFLDRYGAVPTNVQCVCIGEVTDDALKRRCGRKCLIARDACVEEIVKTIESDWQARL